MRDGEPRAVMKDVAWRRRPLCVGRCRRSCARAAGDQGLVDRGQEATGGAIEGEAAVLPGGALAQSREPLHVAPDRTRIRLVRLRQRVRLVGLLLRQVTSLQGRLDHRVTRRSEFLRDGSQEHQTIVCGIRVEGRADRLERAGPRVLNRRTHVSAPEADHVLEAPDDCLARAGSIHRHHESQSAQRRHHGVRRPPQLFQ